MDRKQGLVKAPEAVDTPVLFENLIAIHESLLSVIRRFGDWDGAKSDRARINEQSLAPEPDMGALRSIHKKRKKVRW